MTKSIPLFYSDIPIGFIRLQQQGSRFVFNAECRDIQNGIVRAYACSANNPGIRLLIGVMIPENGILIARRTYTRNDLNMLKILPEQIDVGEIVADGCEISEAGKESWVKCKFPQRLFSDIALKSSLSGACGILVDDNEDPSRVAARLGGGVFYLAPAFCLVQVIKINGVVYGVLGRERDGVPFKIEKI